MSQGLRMTFLIHAVFGFAFGLVMYLVPAQFATFIGWAPIDPIMTAFCGALFLALAVSSVLGYRAHEWAVARPLVEMEITFTVLGTIIGLYYAVFATAPTFIWVAIVIWAVFAVAWIYYFFREAAAAKDMTGGQMSGMTGARPG